MENESGPLEKLMKNPFEDRFEDSRTQHFSNLWWEQRLSVGKEKEVYEKRDRVAISYLRDVLRLDDETIDAFIGKTEALNFPSDIERTVKEIRDVTDDFKFEEIKKIALSYCKNILGLEPQDIASLSKERHVGREVNRAEYEVGLRRRKYAEKADFASFWRNVVEFWPDLYSEEDVKWLIENGDESAINHMFSQWDYTSSVLQKLNTNDYIYNR